VPVIARFRANPAEVRVAIRRWQDQWLVTIEHRRYLRPPVTYAHKKPGRAVTLALREAERQGMPGIDLAMDWAYEHPQGRAANASA
jgi:hypothetical protein